MAIEETLILIKPDGVRRNLVGELLARFERAGLIIEKLKMLEASDALIDAHYEATDEWLISVGEKTKASYDARGEDVAAAFGTNVPKEIGLKVKARLGDYMTSGAVVACVLRGNRAVSTVRKLVGHTFPTEAAPGTIRADYATDSPDLADQEGRSVYNLIHASGAIDEAKREIALWFDSE